ncbi:MAG: hypothetical protein C0596_15695 [Marinilabiliales bacterium]|nr:MAG: hypothetical protein C0596_15695 [Marinilabiliales bacterium]
MKKYIIIFISVLWSLNIFSQTVNGVIDYEDQQFKIVKVWGTHEERGYAVGYLLGEGTNDLMENYLLPAFGSYYDMARNLLLTDAHLKIDSVYIYEAMAMAEGLNDSGEMSMEVDYIDILLANSFLDFENFLSKGLGLENGCSSLIDWGLATAGTDLDCKSVISRHLDWDDQDVIIRNQVLIIHFQSEVDEQPWALIGFEGQMSVLSGFNQSGVAIMQHMLSDEYTAASLNQGYEPVWFTMRKAIETNDFNGDGNNNCLDINAAVNINTNGFADSYIITGVAPSTFENNNEIATIIELAPASPYITIRNTDYEDGIPGDNLYAANWTIARNDALHYCTRYNAIMTNFGDGTGIGKQENWDLMINHSSACVPGGYGNIQFMQYVPEDNYFKLAIHTVGGVQACENVPVEYNTLDLFDIPTIIDHSKSKLKIKTYPNPAADNVTFYIPGIADEDELVIYNSIGKQVKRLNVNVGNTNIDISDLEQGVYLIRLINSGLQTKLIVK